MFYICVRGGLCNRIRVISSGLILARQMNTGLCVVWERQKFDMYARFRDVFMLPLEFQLIDADDADIGRLKKMFCSSNSNFLGQSQFMTRALRENSRARFLQSPASDWFVATCSAFQAESDYTWIRPVDIVAQEVKRWQEQLGENCIGIHIRRTDNFKSIVYSPIELFEEAIDKELKVDPFVRFYLASDDESVKERLISRFGDSVLTRSGLSGRFHEGGTEQALVDLLLLARTKKVLGSYWSSFSSEAAHVGNIPYCCIADMDVNHALQRAFELLSRQYKMIARC